MTGSPTLTLKQVASWSQRGYLTLQGFVPDEIVDRINRLISGLSVATNRQAFANLTVDPLAGAMAGQRLRMGDATDAVFEHPVKINDLYLRSDLIRGVALGPELSAILNQLLDGEPVICNSLNFVRGSQQPPHIDTWYMPPPHGERLIVSSICLEDVDASAGPLIYYPGSHKIPPYRFSHGRLHAINDEMAACNAYLEREIAARGLTQERFLGEKGDVFLWHGQLLHGGALIEDLSKTRRTLVTHYWALDDTSRLPIATTAPGRHYVDREPLSADVAETH